MAVVIYPFGEGVTEKVVFEFLLEKLFGNRKSWDLNVVGGKNNFRKSILDKIESVIKTKRDEIRIIAFRDFDDGEKIDSILQSFQGIVYKLLESWETKPEAVEIIPGSVYKWEISESEEPPGFKFVLHIARIDYLGIKIRNQTTDAYVLRLGLSKNVLRGFAEETKVRSSYETLNELITSSIPDLITGRGITFDEDKDYLAAYLVATRFWVIKRTEEQEQLTKIILKKGWKHNQEEFARIFKSWIQAINEVIIAQ